VTAIALQTDDGLIDVVPVLKNTEAFIASRYGQGLRTHLGKVRNMGRGARGIKGLTLETEDRVIGMTVVEGKKNLFVLTEKGYGKRVEFKNFTAKNRGGKGNKFLKVTDKVGRAVAVKTVADSDEIMIVTEKGVMIRVEASAISVLGRDTQGVRVISVEDDDKVQDVGLVAGDEE
jgi:DNA gyrase subunit A